VDPRHFGGILVSAFESRGPGPLVCFCCANISESSTCTCNREDISFSFSLVKIPLLSPATAPKID